MPGYASRNILYLCNWIYAKAIEIMIKPKAGLVCAGNFMTEICLCRQGFRLQVTTRAMHGGTASANPWQLLPQCLAPGDTAQDSVARFKVTESPDPCHGQRALTWPPARVRWWINLLSFDNLWVTLSPLFMFPAILVTVWNAVKEEQLFFLAGLTLPFHLFEAHKENLSNPWQWLLFRSSLLYKVNVKNTNIKNYS